MKAPPQRILDHNREAKPPVADQESKVRVVIRVRPFLANETKRNDIVVNPADSTLAILNPRNNSENFDRCYNQLAEQTAIYGYEVSPLLEKVCAGHNATIFAYGATGAGKTFTMEGSDAKPAISGLLAILAKATSPWTLTMSVFEIYNERLFDLMADNPRSMDLPIREDNNRNIFVPKLTQVSVEKQCDFTYYFSKAVHARKTGATKLNPSSSRSHCCVMLQIAVGVKSAKLYLIDLAGSEDNRKTGNSGDRLVESGSINRSLFVLNKVVDALNAGAQRIPYRDSKLTRLLQDSLGGRSHALMIVNISPISQDLLESYNTLNFASKSRQVVNVIAQTKTLDPISSPLPIKSRRKHLLLSPPETAETIKGHYRNENNPFITNLVKPTTSRSITAHSPSNDLVKKAKTLQTPMKTLFEIFNSSSEYMSKLDTKKRKCKASASDSELKIVQHIFDYYTGYEESFLYIVNHGSVKQIMDLSEFGKKRAASVVAHRDVHGPFSRAVDLVYNSLVSNKVLLKIAKENALNLSELESLKLKISQPA